MLETAGFRIRQNGEREGIGLFDPTDAKQARLALHIAGVKTSRKLSPELQAAKRALMIRLNASRHDKNACSDDKNAAELLG